MRTTITVRLKEPEVHRALRIAAAKEGLSMNEFCCSALEDAVDEQLKQLHDEQLERLEESRGSSSLDQAMCVS